MLNYFNYFTEIEQRFQQRRGSLLMLSTLDWALIETWRESGLPLDAVLRGIDAAFDKHEAKKHRPGTRKVNGLAWCSQAVMESSHHAAEAATGTLAEGAAEATQSGFETAPIAAYLTENAATLEASTLPGIAATLAAETATRLRTLATELTPATRLEDLDRTLAVLEEKLQNALQLSAPEDQLTTLHEQATRELAPYRGKMQSVQIKQVQQQILHKRLFDAYNLPRLSLFYMRHA